MDAHKRIEAFIELGRTLADLPEFALDQIAEQAHGRNNWFTVTSVKRALKGVIALLDEAPLRAWAAQYPLERTQSKVIGVVMAGNIPLVGFHDFMCVLLSGHKLKAKLSSQDNYLLREIARYLCMIAPEFESRIEFAEQLKNCEAYIATGSDNTARYFDYYFGKYDHIIRKNRVSVAVLNGTESDDQLKALTNDVLQYYGLGCRNVAKLFVPEGYNFVRFLQHAEAAAQEAMQNNRYVNNYEYNKSIYLVNRVPHYDNGGLILTESEALVSPISVLFYSHYTDHAAVALTLAAEAEKIQCIVAGEWFDNAIPFGTAQCPGVAEYADGVDTMQFLCNLAVH